MRSERRSEFPKVTQQVGDQVERGSEVSKEVCLTCLLNTRHLIFIATIEAGQYLYLTKTPRLREVTEGLPKASY